MTKKEQKKGLDGEGRFCIRGRKMCRRGMLRMVIRITVFIGVLAFLCYNLYLNSVLANAVLVSNQYTQTNFNIAKIKNEKTCLAIAQSELDRQEQEVEKLGKTVKDEQKVAFAQQVYNNCLEFEGWGFLVEKDKQ